MSEITQIKIDDTEYKSCHLTVAVSKESIEAIFIDDDTGNVVECLSRQWNYSDDAESLRMIEDFVYENNKLLGDYKTIVIVDCERMIIVPSEQISQDSDDVSKMMSVLYGEVDESDLLCDCVGEQTIVYTMLKGLDSFLNRTFIVVERTTHLSQLIKWFKSASENDGGEKMFVDIDKGYVDIVAFNNKKLQLANRFKWDEISDAAYYVLNVWNYLGFDQQKSELKLSGNRVDREQIMPMLRKYINYVMHTILPSDVKKHNVSLSITLSEVLRMQNK